MIIAIDGYEANTFNRVGIGQYAYELLCHIHRLSENDPDRNAFRIYLPDAPLPDLPKETTWWQYRIMRPRKLWTFMGLPVALTRDTPTADVIFSPTHYVPRFVGIPRVMSIMDLSYLEYPQLFRQKDAYQLTHWTKYAVEHTKKIFTISEFSRNAIMKAYGVPSNHIVVTLPGFTMNKSQKASKETKTFSMPAHYILSVGTLQPRKNFVRLIEAFSRLDKEICSKYPDLKLVIVGKKGWLYDEILAAPERFDVASKVLFLDYVSDADLGSLYQHALLFVLPSLYEGFGLPVLEAMAHKLSIVVSNTSSLPEVAGESGIYVDPASVASIQEGIERALRERGSEKEKQRIAKGLVQVKKFTWEKAAKQTLDILEQIGKGTP